MSLSRSLGMKNSKFQTMEFISTFIPSLSPWCACVCACGCACVYACVPPLEERRECQIPWRWNYGLLSPTVCDSWELYSSLSSVFTISRSVFTYIVHVRDCVQRLEDSSVEEDTSFNFYVGPEHWTQFISLAQQAHLPVGLSYQSLIPCLPFLLLNHHFWDRVSYNPNWSQTHYIIEFSLKFFILLFWLFKNVRITGVYHHAWLFYFLCSCADFVSMNHKKTFICLSFQDKVSLHNPGCPGTSLVRRGYQTCLELDLEMAVSHHVGSVRN